MGVLSLAGESGSVSLSWGGAGAVESSTYLRALEHGEVLPAASVAVALNKVIVLSAIVAPRPGDLNWTAEPDASRMPV